MGLPVDARPHAAPPLPPDAADALCLDLPRAVLEQREAVEEQVEETTTSHSFQELLSMLQAKHEDVLAQNRHLGSELASLRVSRGDGNMPRAAAPAVRGPRQPRGDEPVNSLSLGNREDELLPESGPPVSEGSVRRHTSTDGGLLEVWARDVLRKHPGGSVVIPSSKTISGSRRGDVGCGGCCGCLRSLVMRPDSRFCIFWDFLGLLALTFDTITIPLLVFRDGDSAFDLYSNLAIASFWTADMCQHFFRSFELPGGVMEVRPWHIARRYLLRSFTVDFTLVMCDWTLIFLEISTLSIFNLVRSSKLLRLVRVFRWFRLLRAIKLSGVLDRLQQELSESITPDLLVIIKSLIFLLFLNHFVACAWYGIAALSNAGPSWIQQQEELASRELGYLYVAALHWSVTQFTPASTNVHATNLGERVFSVFVISLSVALFSSFVSRITATMTRFIAERWSHMEQSNKLKRYLFENGLTPDLSLRITRFARSCKFSGVQRVRRKDVFIFRALPQRLQLMLDWETYSPILQVHPFFHHCCEADCVGMIRVCSSSLEEVSLRQCEELFRFGQEAQAMYFTVSGVMKFFRGFDDLLPVDINGKERKWLCEPALWTQWTHRGNLFTISQCDFLKLSAGTLHAVISKLPSLMGPCLVYAKNFKDRLDMLETQGQAGWGDLEDDLGTLLEMAHGAFEGQLKRVSTRPLRHFKFRHQQVVRSLTTLVSGREVTGSATRR